MPDRHNMEKLRDELMSMTVPARRNRLEKLIKKNESEEHVRQYKHMLKYLVEAVEQEPKFEKFLKEKLKALNVKRREVTPELIHKIQDEFNDNMRSKNVGG